MNTFEDAGQMGFYLMAALSWPSSLLVVWGGRLLHLHLDGWTYDSASTGQVIAIWLSFFAVGCLQWIVLPWALHRRRIAGAPACELPPSAKGDAVTDNSISALDHEPETGSPQPPQM